MCVCAIYYMIVWRKRDVKTTQPDDNWKLASLDIIEKYGGPIYGVNVICDDKTHEQSYSNKDYVMHQIQIQHEDIPPTGNKNYIRFVSDYVAQKTDKSVVINWMSSVVEKTLVLCPKLIQRMHVKYRHHIIVLVVAGTAVKEVARNISTKGTWTKGSNFFVTSLPDPPSSTSSSSSSSSVLLYVVTHSMVPKLGQWLRTNSSSSNHHYVFVVDSYNELFTHFEKDINNVTTTIQTALNNNLLKTGREEAQQTILQRGIRPMDINKITYRVIHDNLSIVQNVANRIAKSTQPEGVNVYRNPLWGLFYLCIISYIPLSENIFTSPTNWKYLFARLKLKFQQMIYRNQAAIIFSLLLCKVSILLLMYAGLFVVPMIDFYKYGDKPLLIGGTQQKNREELSTKFDYAVRIGLAVFMIGLTIVLVLYGYSIKSTNGAQRAMSAMSLLGCIIGAYAALMSAISIGDDELTAQVALAI